MTLLPMLYITLFYCFSGHCVQDITVYNQTTDAFCQEWDISPEQKLQKKQLFSQAFIDALRQRFDGAHEITRGEKSPGRVGIPILASSMSAGVTALLTHGDSYYITFATAGTAIVTRWAQELSNSHYKKFLSHICYAYASYIGSGSQPLSLFEQSLINSLWQKYQFPVLLLQNNSISSLATEINEQLFQNSLNFSKNFKKELIDTIKSQSPLPSIPPIYTLLSQVAEEGRTSILGTQEQGIKWVLKAFLSGIDKKPHCCTWYNRIHKSLKGILNIQKTWHPCQKDGHTLTGYPVKLFDILKYGCSINEEEIKDGDYLSSPLLLQMTKGLFPYLKNITVDEQKIFFSNDGLS